MNFFLPFTSIYLKSLGEMYKGKLRETRVNICHIMQDYNVNN